MNMDMINGTFELVGGLLWLINIKQILKDKQIKGVSLIPQFFFTSWACWNVVYYPSLEQWYSFYGGLFLFASNGTWLVLALYYKFLNKKHLQ